jgi:uncharacterized protein YjbI with pentapeptide repeats
MVEITSVSEVKQQLSAADRLCLIQTLNALPTPQFDELVFALNPPKGNIPNNSASQSSRSTALLEWAESPLGPGLATLEKCLSKIIATHSKTAETFLAFVISGKINDSTAAELQAFVELLRKKTGDNSIDIAFFKEGSIKVILNGSPEGLAKLQELFEDGELEQLDLPPVEAITPVDSSHSDARKARLIQALRLSCGKVNHILALIHDLDPAINLSNADLSGANLRNLNLVGANLTDADLTNADITQARFGDNSRLTESEKQSLQSRGAIFTDSPSSNVPNLDQEDVQSLIWPQNKPVAEIVFPLPLSTSQGNVATLWAMMPEEEINRRIASTRYNTFICTMTPHPMMLWLTALYSSNYGSRWLPCYIDLKSTLGEDIAILLSKTGSYKLLLFALENPNQCAHMLSCSVSEPQRSLLQEWVWTARNTPSTGAVTVSRDILRNELKNKLKPQVLQKLEAIGSSKHLVISHAYA